MNPPRQTPPRQTPFPALPPAPVPQTAPSATPPRRSRQAQQEETRRKLLESAEALILEQSIPALSMRAVSARGGYTQGAFYANFADRDALLLAVMGRHMAAERDSLVRALADLPVLSFDDSLQAISAWLGNLSGRRAWAILATELRLQALRDPAFGQRLSEAERQAVAAFAEVIAALAARYGLQPRLTPRTLAASLLQLWRALALAPDPQAVEDDTAIFLAVLRGLLPGQGAAELPPARP